MHPVHSHHSVACRDTSRRGFGRRLARTLGALAVAGGALAIVVPAFANDLSTNPCTAQDVEIVGNGFVTNEPCSCTPGATFDAVVQFTVRNNTSTGRYCIALHLVPDGASFPTAFDVLLKDGSGSSTAPGKSGGENYHDTIMYGTIANYPCNNGIVCFGQAGVTRGKCAPNQCTTVAWSTSTGAANCTSPDQSPPGGQCRHQQVCIVGYGATLTCLSGCNAKCGETTTLQACVSGSALNGPFTFHLASDDGSASPADQSKQVDASGNACVTFTATPTKTPTTTYTLTVTDNSAAKCTRSDTATVSVSTITASISAPATDPCDGVFVYTASVAGQTGCTFAWTIDGVSPATFAAAGASGDARVGSANAEKLSFRALDNTCHTIGVTATCGSCTATASTTASQCVSTTKGCTVK